VKHAAFSGLLYVSETLNCYCATKQQPLQKTTKQNTPIKTLTKFTNLPRKLQIS
jgi:hypothetical protein